VITSTQSGILFSSNNLFLAKLSKTTSFLVKTSSFMEANSKFELLEVLFPRVERAIAFPRPERAIAPR
jgi:hypothetical protein